MHLLLVALRVWIEEDQSRVGQCLLGILSSLGLCFYHLVVEREEHTVKKATVLSFNGKPPSIKVPFKHLLKLVIRMKNVHEGEATAISMKAAAVKRSICPLDNSPELNDKLFIIQNKLLVDFCIHNCYLPIHCKWQHLILLSKVLRIGHIKGMTFNLRLNLYFLEDLQYLSHDVADFGKSSLGLLL